MDGDTALWYVRSRYSSSDIDRGRRSQEVLKALFKKLMSLDVVNHLPELYEVYKNNVETNLSLEIIAPLVEIAPYLLEDDLRLRSYQIDFNHVTPYRVPDTGAQVLLPRQDAILSVIRAAFFGQ